MTASNQKPTPKKKDPKQEEEIFKPPVFTREPQNKQVLLGSRVMLQVAATGLPLPSFQWYFKGQPIKGATSNRLIFPKIRNAHRGNYYCIAQNYVGKTISKEVMVNIMPRATIHLTISPSEAQLKRGKKFSFQVVSPNLEKLEGFSFQWTLNGKKITGATGPKLEFTELKPKYSGEYKLLILRGAEIKSSNIAKLKVLDDYQAEKIVTVSGRDSIQPQPGSESNVKVVSQNFEQAPGIFTSINSIANKSQLSISNTENSDDDFFFTPERIPINDHDTESIELILPIPETDGPDAAPDPIDFPAALLKEPAAPTGSLLDFLDPEQDAVAHEAPSFGELPLAQDPYHADEISGLILAPPGPETSRSASTTGSPDKKALVKRVRVLYRLMEIVKERKRAS